MSDPELATEQLSNLTRKRLALESLIKITVSIQSQQQSLLDISVIAKPSQEFPAKLLAHVKALSKRIGKLPVTELIQRLEAIENVMEKSLGNVILLAKVDYQQLRDEKFENLSIDNFVDSINNFKRRTQTAVALRFMLVDRGVVIAPYSLSIPQEALVEQIEKLKAKEKKCVKQIRKEIVEIAKDTERLIQDKDIGQSMKVELEKITLAMTINLQHLDRGGSVSEIPNMFETIVLESNYADSITIEAVQEDSPPANQDNIETSKEACEKESIISSHDHSFWYYFKRWLMSPWGVSWKKLKKETKK